MAYLRWRPESLHRDFDDIQKFYGEFDDVTYQDTECEYDLIHRVEWAKVAANGAAGSPLDPVSTFIAVKNYGTTDVLLYLNTIINWPNPAFEVVIKPGHWVAFTDLDTFTQPRIRVDSALYSAPCECEILEIGWISWEEEEPEWFCDMWAVGHIPQDDAGTKHYPEAGAWLTIPNNISDVEYNCWLADTAGVAVNDYWMVGYKETAGTHVSGILAQWTGAAPWLIEGGALPPFYGNWGFSVTDHYAVGGLVGQAEVWHYNGAWSAFYLPEQEERIFRAVHGHDPACVWVVGDAGIIYNYNGAVWTLCPCDTNDNLYGVWADNALDVWAVGGDLGWWGASGGTGTIYRQTIMGWLPVFVASNTLRAIWGFGTNDIWAVGDQGLIVHWDGFNWTETVENGSYDYRGVFGCWPWSVWAVGTSMTGDNIIVHWDTVSWTINHGPNLDEMDLLGLKGVEVVPV